ncbi:MAG: hypothetical protein GQ477_02395 [Nanohaloarchaea archaeon]|nr:hypothetical protein [Candidatus Nanohaloarchaea archaeon]
MENITGIPIYAIDKNDNCGIIYTIAVVATGSAYGRLTMRTQFDEIPEQLTPNAINLLKNKTELDELMALSKNWNYSDGSVSFQSTIYADESCNPAIVLRTEDTNILTSKNFKGLGDVMAIKNINYDKTTFKVGSKTSYNSGCFYDTVGPNFVKQFNKYDNCVELVNIFNALWSSLFDKKIIEDYNLKNILEMDESKFLSEVNHSGMSVFALPHKYVLIDDLINPKRINPLDEKWLAKQNDF